jgi:DNA-binding LytR/AlgR family response regulator
MTKNKHKRILIVEDELIIAYDIKMILEELGYEVTDIADNASDAIESIQNNTPDLILLDINLGSDTDGVMLAQDINNMFHIPFVYLTSNADPVTINRVKRTRPAGFIVKPFQKSDLQSNIEIALFNNQKEQQPGYFFIKDERGFTKLNINEILYAKAEDNYTLLITKKGDYLLSLTLKKVLEKLPEKIFIRIHRSYIVNLNKIDRIQEGIVCIGEHKLSVGRSYHDILFDRISKL